MEYLFLGLIASLGLLTSYTDIKHGSIKNKHLIIIFLCGILVYAMTRSFSFDILFATVITIVISFLLYWKRILAPGDSKLQVLYAFLIPFDAFSNYLFLPYPHLALLFNIAIISSGLMLLFNIHKLKIRVKDLLNKDLAQNILLSIISIISISWLIRIVMNYFDITGMLVSYLIAAIIHKLIRKYLKKMYLIVIYIGLILYRAIFYDFSFLNEKIVLIITISALFELIIKTLGSSLIIKTDNIRPYMHLKDGRVVKKEQISKMYGQYAVKENVAFAPYMFISVLITVLSKSLIVIGLLK